MDISGASLRAKMKEKARRIAGGSDWENPSSSFKQGNAMDNDAVTGMRPIGRQNRKDGGLVKDLANRDMKEANEERPGKKHIDGMKSGGDVKKAGGGSLAPTTSIRPQRRPADTSMIPKAKDGDPDYWKMKQDVEKTKAAVDDVGSSEPDGMKKGGMVKHPKGCDCKSCGGMVIKKAGGGGVPAEWIKHKVDSGQDLDKLRGSAEKSMNKYKGEKIKSFYKSQMDAIDSHRSGKAGGGPLGLEVAKLSPAAMLLGVKAKGGAVDREGRKAGGKTNINIIIQQPKGGLGEAGMPPPQMNPPLPPMPPPGAGAPPPMMPHPAGPGIGPMPGGGVPPMMGHASGGAVKMGHGAGGGLGRLEKIRKYGNNAKSGEIK